jgi:preprotein translocase subunit Sss1
VRGLRTVGLSLIGVSLIGFASFILWANTRNLEPLKAEIPLSPGEHHYIFRANVRYLHVVELDVASRLPVQQIACSIGVTIGVVTSLSNKLEHCEGYPAPGLHLKWVLMGHTGEIAHSLPDNDYVGSRLGEHEASRFLGSFQITHLGLYDLIVTVNPNTSDLSQYRATLTVSVSPEFSELLSVIFLLGGGVSILGTIVGLLFLMAGIATEREKRTRQYGNPEIE